MLEGSLVFVKRHLRNKDGKKGLLNQYIEHCYILPSAGQKNNFILSVWNNNLSAIYIRWCPQSFKWINKLNVVLAVCCNNVWIHPWEDIISLTMRNTSGVHTSCPASVFSNMEVQCSCKEGRLGKLSARMRVDNRRGPKQIRPVCFRQRSNMLQHHHIIYMHNTFNTKNVSQKYSPLTMLQIQKLTLHWGYFLAPTAWLFLQN